jgi:hypothetical protein
MELNPYVLNLMLKNEIKKIIFKKNQITILMRGDFRSLDNVICN